LNISGKSLYLFRPRRKVKPRILDPCPQTQACGRYSIRYVQRLRWEPWRLKNQRQGAQGVDPLEAVGLDNLKLVSHNQM
jgi:hypothetical protein